jgi:hypothetical protein
MVMVIGLRLLCIAGFALILAAAAGAEEGAPELGFISGGDVWAANADGLSARRLTVSGSVEWAAWSPDGTQIAFLRRPDTSGAVEIYVADARGTGVRRLTAESRHFLAFGTEPTWSPDGSKLALVTRDGGSGPSDVWTVAADGTGSHRVTADRLEESGLQWATSSELLYSTYDPNPAIRAVSVETGTWRLVARGSLPALSPDRTRLAYVAAGAVPGLQVSDLSGASRRPLPVPGVLPTQPSWSPDGRRIAFVGQIPTGLTFRFAPPYYAHLWILDADTGAARRITGYPGDTSIPDGSAGIRAPVWWAGGERLFFFRFNGLNMIQADGQCEQPYTALPSTIVRVFPRPGARMAAPPLSCVDLWTRSFVAASEVGRGQPVRVAVTVRNVGNITASKARLALSPIVGGRVESVMTQYGACDSAAIESTGCDLGEIAPGEEERVSFLLLRDRPGGVGTRATAVSISEPDVRGWNDTAEIGASISTCSIVGTWGSDVLVGTRGADYICGRPGADRIGGAGGNDRIEAGSGADTVSGGPGRDTVLGGGGADVILVRDGERDAVACGTERDTVFADRKDRVASDCEHVDRR